jgi:hypothetical protein
MGYGEVTASVFGASLETGLVAADCLMIKVER